jgi:hypothetical protein
MYKIGFLYSNAAPGNVVPTPPPDWKTISYDDILREWSYTDAKISGTTGPINIQITYPVTAAAQLYYFLGATPPLGPDVTLSPVDNDFVPINSGDIIYDVPPNETIWFGVDADPSLVSEENVIVTVTNVSLANTVIDTFLIKTIVEFYNVNLTVNNSIINPLNVVYAIASPPSIATADQPFYNIVVPVGVAGCQVNVSSISIPKNALLYVGLLTASGKKVQYAASQGTIVCPVTRFDYCGSYSTNLNPDAVFSFIVKGDEDIALTPLVDILFKEQLC